MTCEDLDYESLSESAVRFIKAIVEDISVAHYDRYAVEDANQPPGLRCLEQTKKELAHKGFIVPQKQQDYGELRRYRLTEDFDEQKFRKVCLPEGPVATRIRKQGMLSIWSIDELTDWFDDKDPAFEGAELLLVELEPSFAVKSGFVANVKSGCKADNNDFGGIEKTEIDIDDTASDFMKRIGYEVEIEE